MPDSTNNEMRQLMGENQLRKLKDTEVMNDSSLRRYLGIDNERYLNMLLECKLLRKRGDKMIVSPEMWKQFFTVHKIAAEFELAAPMGTRRAWYVRIGKMDEQKLYHKNVCLQARYCEFAPPRCNGIDVIRRALKDGLRRLMPTQDELDKLKATAATTNDDSCNNNNNNNDNNSAEVNDTEAEADAEDDDNANINMKNFPLLKKLGIGPNELDLTNKKNMATLQLLMGEMINIQQAHSKNKAKIEFIRPQQNKVETAVVIQSHKSDEAFLRYHRHTPYIDEVIHSMDGDEEVAVTRLVVHLGKKYDRLFVSAAKETSLVACGIMNEIDCGALISEAGLLDSQWKILVRHLKYNFKAQMAVPFKRVKSECCQGVTEPRMKVIEHRRDGCETEIVVAEYQSVTKEFLKCVERLLVRYSIKSRSSIEGGMCVIGGDHGCGAFRLCMNVLLKITGSDDPINEVVSIAKVFCAKEEGVLLDDSIMSWLESDLQKMNDSLLMLRLSEDKSKFDAAFCHASDVDLELERDKDAFPVVIEQKLAGDCAWQSFCNGKTNMSNHWCIYCPLHRSEFATHTGPIENWTIESLTAMADDDTKTGAARLGVTNRPYFPWISIMNRVLPVLHLLIGVGNDVINYFGHVVEWTLIEIPEEERKWKEDVETLKVLIETYKRECNEWDSSPHGESTKSKRRSALMSLKRSRSATANGNRLTDDEQAEFDLLNGEFKETRKKRDDAQAKRRDLLKKINEAAKGRRRPPKEVNETWYLLMEKIYRRFNVVREDYHKRQFAGRPMREIMKNAQGIFDDAKVMLRRFKRQDDADIDAKIDAHCDKVIDILKTWDKFFSLLHKTSPTEADFNELKAVATTAEEKHRLVRTVVDNSDDVPKPHISGAHAYEQFRQHGGCLSKIYEQFVEKNHQTESEIEAQTKRIPNHEQRVKTAANIRAMGHDWRVNKKQKLVKDETARAPYKKSS